MEIIHSPVTTGKIKAVLFDFDGTISTLRCGWENVMGPLFCEVLDDGSLPPKELKAKVDSYIDESTGIQTIQQMKWLRDEVEKQGRPAKDIWDYKKDYNDRLMRVIEKKLARLSSGQDTPAQYLMAGAVEFLQALKERQIQIYVASGTDHPDVLREAQALGVSPYFDEIKGAPRHEESCSKEAVIRRLLTETGLRGQELCVCGDGKVEIRLGMEHDARTIGLASNEKARHGVDEVKRQRLVNAGADIIVGDFLEKETLLAFMGYKEA